MCLVRVFVCKCVWVVLFFCVVDGFGVVLFVCLVVFIIFSWFFYFLFFYYYYYYYLFYFGGEGYFTWETECSCLGFLLDC